jgi:hypothetical protein
VRKEEGAQPTGCRILCQTHKERTECRVEKDGKWADHDQYFKTNDEVQHDRTTEVRFTPAHRSPCMMLEQFR